MSFFKCFRLMTVRWSRILIIVVFIAIIAALTWRFVDLDSLGILPPTTHPTALAFVASNYNWSSLEPHYPVKSFVPLPTGSPKTLPRIQFDFPHADIPNATIEARRTEVRNAFTRCWKSYKEHAWLHDELTPVAGGYNDHFGGWAATLVDSLDTLWIMDLKEEFYLASVEAVKIDWNKTAAADVNLFETTIRHLGGLLSAYDLSQEPAFLLKAEELGDMLYAGFDTPNRLPVFHFNFQDAMSGSQSAGSDVPSAVPASLALEFTRLSQLTGKDKYYDAIYRVRAFLERTQESSLLPGMWPRRINFQNETVAQTEFCIGSDADSLYEYLPKMHVILSGQDESYSKMHLRAMATVSANLLFPAMLPGDPDVLFSGIAHVVNSTIDFNAEVQHLGCFAGGMFGLSGKVFGIEEHVRVGDRLARGCAWAYQAMPIGVMLEVFRLFDCKTPSLQGCSWNEEKWKGEGDTTLPPGFRDTRDVVHLLRPEAVESLFILYRITGEEDLRELAWNMFKSVMRATETEYGNSAIKDVRATGETIKLDSMESFWLAETLKYYYLIFSPPDLISLDEYIFNTEAHPLRYRA